jgi:O-antigen/teichoic acid export membrane protein
MSAAASADAGARSEIQRAAGSAVRLLARFGLVTVISGVITIVLTRTFGPRGYGPYASALATWSLLGAIADFGLTPMLSRDTAHADAPPSPETYRSAYKVATVWCIVLAAIQVGLAFSAGISSTRGTILLILVPGMLFNSLNPARTVFLVVYRTGLLLTLDALTAVVQAATVLSLLAAGQGPEAVAAVVVVSSVVNNLAVLTYAERLLRDVIDPGYGPRDVIRRAAPLAILSILNQVYFTIDLVLLGWLVHGPRLGDYAAASKLLQLLAGISGVVVTGSLPALSARAREGGALEPMLARIWHWLLVVIMPAFATLAVVAPLAIRVAFTHTYAPAAPLLRILCLAGIVSPICNIAGSVQVALTQTRALFVQNGAAAAFNVAGNLILVPIAGVAAAAWLTFATDVLVGSLALRSLRHAVAFRRILPVTVRPLAALAAALAVELILVHHPWPAVGLGLAMFVVVATTLGAWPEEFYATARRLARRGRRR